MKKEQRKEDYRIKYEKLKIHMGYWIFMLSVLSIGLFALRANGNENLSSEIAFGATLSGIILSVIAIIMTIVGETKSENTKDTLMNLSTDLEGLVEDIKDATKNLENVHGLSEGVQRIEAGMSEIYNMKSSYSDSEEKDILDIDYVKIYKLYISEDNDKLTMYTLAGMYCTILCLEKNKLNEIFKIKEIMRKYDKEGYKNDLINISMGSNVVFSPIVKMISNENKFNKYIKNEMKEKYKELKIIIDRTIL